MAEEIGLGGLYVHLYGDPAEQAMHLRFVPLTG